MKKLFLLIISIFNFGLLFPVNKPVKASINQDIVEKEIIARVGSITYEDLQYNGYSILSSNVNFNRPGRYNICYQNDETKEKIEKQVNIKTLEEMINGVVYSKENCIEINTDGSYSFKKVSKDDDGSYYISYTRTYINEIDSSQTFDMGIIKIKNDEIVYQKVLLNKGNGTIVDFFLNNKEVVVLIENSINHNYSDLKLLVLDVDGNIIIEKQFIGNGIDTGIKLIKGYNQYFLICKTTSNNGDFVYKNNKQRGVVFIFDQDTHNHIYTYNIYDETNTFSIDDAIVIYDQLYIATSTYNGNYFDIELKHFNTRSLEEEKSIYILGTSNSNLVSMKSTPNDELLLSIEEIDINNNKKCIIYAINDNSKELIYEEPLNNDINSYLVDFIAIEKNEYILLYHLFDFEREAQYGYLYKMIKDKKTLFEIENFTKSDSVGSFVENAYDELVFNSENRLLIENIEYSYLDNKNQQIIYHPSDKIVEPYVYAGGEKLSIDKAKSKTVLSTDQYGTYSVKYYFENKDLIYIFSDEIIIKPYVSLVNNQIYDLNTKVYFNGLGILNGLPINSGYIIEKEGDYTLKIIGINEEEYIINFKIKKLSLLKPEYILEEPRITQIITEEIDVQKAVVSENIDVSMFTTSKKNNLWYILIPISLLLVLGIVIKKRG